MNRLFFKNKWLALSLVVIFLAPLAIAILPASATDSIIWQYGTTGVAGSGANQLALPHGAEYLSNGNVLISDQDNHRVIEVDSNQNIVWQYGTTAVAGTGVNQLNKPHDAKRLTNGNTLITDRDNHRVIEVDSDRNIVWQYGTTGMAGTGGNQLNRPYEAERLTDGNTLISDRQNYRVIEVDSNKNIVWQYGTTGVWGSGVNYLNTAVDANRLSNGNTLITDCWNSQVIEVRTSDYNPALPNNGFSQGSIVWQYGTTGVKGLAYNQLNVPLDAERLPNGNTLISDTNFDIVGDGFTPEFNDRVIEVDANKNIVWQYGTGVTGSGDNQLNHPYSAKRLSSGSTLIADRLNHRVIIVGDATPPTTTFTTSPISPDGDNGWFKTVPSITLTPDEPATTYYSWVSATGPWISYSTSFNAPTDENTLYYYSVDSLSNTEVVKSALFKVDTGSPTSAITSPSEEGRLNGASYDITGSSSDPSSSGVAKIEVSTDGGITWNLATETTSWSYSWTLPSDGSYNIKSRATDNAGNVEAPGAGVNVTVDNTAPTVTATSPPDSATGVSISADVTATFSEDMGSSTINTSTFTLKDSANNPVSGTVSYNSSIKTTTLNPSSDLAYSTTYTATMTTGVKDLAGNPLASDKAWSFTTQAAPSGGGGGGGGAPAAAEPNNPTTSSVQTREIYERNGEIRGRVVNMGGQVIPGTAVRIDSTVIPTNPGGEFRFTLVHPGIYTIYYDAPGYIGQTQIIEVNNGNITTPPMVILDRLGEIWGRVINRAGRPIRGAAVRINNTVMPTNASGEFRFTLVHNGIYTVNYDAPRYKRQVQEYITVVANKITRPPTVIMSL